MCCCFILRPLITVTWLYLPVLHTKSHLRKEAPEAESGLQGPQACALLEKVSADSSAWAHIS